MRNFKSFEKYKCEILLFITDFPEVSANDSKSMMGTDLDKASLKYRRYRKLYC